jgi:hypothetical protein
LEVRILKFYIMESPPRATESIRTVPIGIIGKYAGKASEAPPVSYTKNAKLRESVFTLSDANIFILSVDSRIFVGHAEPLEALA